MTISFELPVEIEQSLRESVGDVNAATKEAALVELYRQGKLTHFELGRAMEISRLEVEAVLKKHNVTEDLPTAEEAAADFENLRRLLKR